MNYNPSINKDEQSNPVTDHQSNVKTITVKAGHVEIVGNDTFYPSKLLKILHENELLNFDDENIDYEITHIIRQVYQTPQLPK
ncbi:hypothetical protein [Photobacterium satsumensis]|uniref:hypothetical protein n=1 Tax=Photobacterium satsumensis TaxID=2910239 RepID=UPI003D0D3EB3